MQANAVNYMDLKNSYFHTTIWPDNHQNFEKLSFYQFFYNYSRTFYAKWINFKIHPFHQNILLKCGENFDFLNMFWRKIFASDSEFLVFPLSVHWWHKILIFRQINGIFAQINKFRQINGWNLVWSFTVNLSIVVTKLLIIPWECPKSFYKAFMFHGKISLQFFELFF